MRDFAFGRWFTAIAVTASLCTAVVAAPTAKHAPAPASAQKKDAPKKDPQKKDEPNISAPHAILIDGENGGVLFERDADRLIFPASLAKLMTAEYVFNEIKEGRLKLTDEFMVSENAWRKGGAPSHGSTMFAAIYSKVPVDDLIHAMIIQSANDACIILAEGLAGSEAAFAEKLTERARAIGL
ncbi:MAG: serine hydrolase, partial [Pseudolabrys sp.]